MDILSILSLVVLVFGDAVTYLSKKISSFIFKGEERDAEADNLKVKSFGFIIALIGACALFILKK